VSDIVELIKIELTLDSDCVCVKYDHENDCDLLDEKGNPIPEDSCLGCWEDALEEWKNYVYPEWIARNKITDRTKLVIEYSNVTWRNGSGAFQCQVRDLEDGRFGFLKGDFRITYTLEGKDLTARRSSHDEPTGAYFKFVVGRSKK
jgi:hypothetical protein